MNQDTDCRQPFHRGTAPIFAILTLDQTRQLAAVQGDPNLEERIAVLAQKANEGELSAEEVAEYEDYIAANDLLTVLRSEARFHLAQTGS